MSAAEMSHAGLQDLPELRDFSDRAYRKNDITFTNAYFDWQFNRCGGAARPHNGALIARKGGAVIGNCLVPSYDISMNGEIRQGGWIHEWFVDPGHGALGLIMLRKMLKGLAFFAGAGISSHGLAAMRAVCPTMTLFALNRTFAVFDAEKTFALSFHTKPCTLTYLKGLRPPPPPATVTVELIDRFDARFDAAWDAFREGITLATHRTSAFMNWRYLDHPVFTYQAARASGPAGDVHCVWRMEQVHGSDTRVARICEVIGSPQAIAESLPAILAVMGADGAAFADFFCSHAETVGATITAGMHAVVARSDFVLARLFQPLADTVAHSLDYYFYLPGAARPGDYSRCYFTKGDSNQDRPNIVS